MKGVLKMVLKLQELKPVKSHSTVLGSGQSVFCSVGSCKEKI